MRERAGLTLERLGELADVDHGHLSNVERGKKSPSIELLFDIAAVLRCPLGDLLADQDNPDRLRNEEERALVQLFRAAPGGNRAGIIAAAARAGRVVSEAQIDAELERAHYEESRPQAGRKTPHNEPTTP